ncbi:hypothetical protein ACN38_g9987 [Penicillium nordicum]|uniref:Uncharacterized protein n=1 Tax=Penicillium nordicum TaxID=229535 RepID=A0A0M8P2P6_9EURO|nr:hypothetical protein ACN38_g9987 [Penicillium nordicum]
MCPGRQKQWQLVESPLGHVIYTVRLCGAWVSPSDKPMYTHFPTEECQRVICLASALQWLPTYAPSRGGIRASGQHLSAY